MKLLLHLILCNLRHVRVLSALLILLAILQGLYTKTYGAPYHIALGRPLNWGLRIALTYLAISRILRTQSPADEACFWHTRPITHRVKIWSTYLTTLLITYAPFVLLYLEQAHWLQAPPHSIGWTVLWEWALITITYCALASSRHPSTAYYLFMLAIAIFIFGDIDRKYYPADWNEATLYLSLPICGIILLASILSRMKGFLLVRLNWCWLALFVKYLSHRLPQWGPHHLEISIASKVSATFSPDGELPAPTAAPLHYVGMRCALTSPSPDTLICPMRPSIADGESVYRYPDEGSRSHSVQPILDYISTHFPQNTRLDALLTLRGFEGNTDLTLDDDNREPPPLNGYPISSSATGHLTCVLFKPLHIPLGTLRSGATGQKEGRSAHISNHHDASGTIEVDLTLCGISPPLSDPKDNMHILVLHCPATQRGLLLDLAITQKGPAAGYPRFPSNLTFTQTLTFSSEDTPHLAPNGEPIEAHVFIAEKISAPFQVPLKVLPGVLRPKEKYTLPPPPPTPSTADDATFFTTYLAFLSVASPSSLAQNKPPIADASPQRLVLLLRAMEQRGLPLALLRSHAPTIAAKLPIDQLLPRVQRDSSAFDLISHYPEADQKKAASLANELLRSTSHPSPLSLAYVASLQQDASLSAPLLTCFTTTHDEASLAAFHERLRPFIPLPQLTTAVTERWHRWQAAPTPGYHIPLLAAHYGLGDSLAQLIEHMETKGTHPWLTAETLQKFIKIPPEIASSAPSTISAWLSRTRPHFRFDEPTRTWMP